MNNAVSIGCGIVPLVGDVASAVWKTNWRNAALLENCTHAFAHTDLRNRGSSMGGGENVIHNSAVNAYPGSSTSNYGAGPGQAPAVPPRNV